MNVHKNRLISIVILVVLGAIVFLVFWAHSFFIDEYNYVYFIFSDNNLSVTTDPSNLFEKSISRWTDVSAIFRNSSQTECTVAVRSETLEQSFNVAPGSEYGIILPKKEDVSILFCGVQKIIRVN